MPDSKLIGFYGAYANQFRKVEAEWTLAVLDMHGGDADAARDAILEAVDRCIAARAKGERPTLGFDRDVEAACVANRMWFPEGLSHLKALGKIK